MGRTSRRRTLDLTTTCVKSHAIDLSEKCGKSAASGAVEVFTSSFRGSLLRCNSGGRNLKNRKPDSHARPKNMQKTSPDDERQAFPDFFTTFYVVGLRR